MGYQACLNATDSPPAEGNVGAGMGATVGKILGIGQAMKSGIGVATTQVGNGLLIGAIVAVNAFGDVIDPKTGQIIAGARSPKAGSMQAGSKGYFADTLQVMKTLLSQAGFEFKAGKTTVIGVVATNAKLNKEQVNKVAQMAQDGLARTVRPAHTMVDGDTIFAIATGQIEADVNIIGSFAAEMVAEAILRSVRMARPIAGLPTASEIQST